jgi:CRP-like cAMP-binding protein
MKIIDLLSTNSQSLQQVRLFHNLPPTELSQICEVARPSQVKRGGIFFHQDDPATTLYVLLQGQVKMTQVGLDGHQVIIRVINPGEDFGAIAVLTDVAYPLSAQVVEDSLALAWEKNIIVDLLTAYPTIALNALQLVADRFKQLQQRYRELATKPVEQRVARALLRLVSQAGREVETGLLIDLSLSRQNLAEMTGTTLYTTSRLLSEWKRQGLVETGREQVIIRQLAALRAIAENQ